MQLRADDMLRGELLSALLKRRGMAQEGGGPDGSSSSSSGMNGSAQQQVQLQLEPEPEWSLPPFVPPQPEPPAAASLQQEQQAEQLQRLEQLQQLEQQQLQQWQRESSPPPPPAAAAAAAAATAAVPAPRRRGRPRKNPLPAVAPGSSLVAAAEGAAEGLAENYGAAVALAAYQDTLSRQPLVDVSVCLQAKLEFGTRVRVVGGHASLGELSVQLGPEANLSSWNRDAWLMAGCTALRLPPGSELHAVAAVSRLLARRDRITARQPAPPAPSDRLPCAL